MANPITYADSGVDIDKANMLVSAISRITKQTKRPGVIGDIGGFAGLFSMERVIADMQHPVLVSSTDGVGTKLKIAFMLDKHDTIGIDLVAMCVNDILVQGAKPLFMLDYLAMGRLDNQRVEAILSGIAEGCKQAKCALIGGETAEMPGMYHGDEYDLAGFVVGIVDNSQIIDGTAIRLGHRLIGIGSSGLHSNGYSLVRKICFDHLKLKLDAYIPELGRSLGEELIAPTRIYTDTVQGLLRDLPIHGLAHITGGGIVDNIVRIIPQAFSVLIRKDSWKIPPIFGFLQQAGNVPELEMLRTFNNGIGMIAVVPESSAPEVIERLTAMNERAFLIGEIIERREAGERLVWG
ncbi:MAG: phosphoribosylformylglycinamidine cyclo-ligase [Desulfobacterales bacterium]|jgi:phosphoribosylformylglycinamidine cyclo-ligase|nr:phosphoribosylformylglycinamidine cyclo-ligase [Desulfobacterales bacterium]